MNPAIADPPRRKRLKVVRACSECRRKKTRCNGENPCVPCLKTHSNCQYTNPAKLLQQKQAQPLTDLNSQMAPTNINTKHLSNTANSKTPSIPTLETNQSTSTSAINSTLLASPSAESPTGSNRHDIRIPIPIPITTATSNNNNTTTSTTNNTRARSPTRKPVTYTIQAIEQRLLEIEKTLGLLLQRHYPALPALVLSSPSSCSASSTSTDTSFKTHTKDSMTTSSTTGTVSALSSHHISQGLTFGDYHSPRISLTLPPLQTRQLTHDVCSSTTSSSSTPSSSSGAGLLLPYHDTGLLFDRKIPALQPLLPHHHQQQQQQQKQDGKQGPSTVPPPPLSHSPTYYYHHSSLHTITPPSHPSCIP